MMILLQLFVSSFVAYDIYKTIKTNDKNYIGAVLPYQAAMLVFVLVDIYKDLN